MNISVLGPVNQIVADDLIFAYPEEKIWNVNGVSLKRRVQDDASFAARIEKAITASNLQKYMVPSDIKAPTRCIDGRIVQGWAEGDVVLGPKVAGGTAHAALAHRIVDTENLRKDLQFEQDIDYVIQRYKEIGVGFGGHVDSHQHGWNTGCGAVDNINLILDRLQLPEPQQQLRRLTNVILGDAYESREIINEIIGRMLYLDALKPHYMPRENDDPTGEFLYKRTIVDLIRQQSDEAHEPVPALEGTHNEVAVVLNFVPNTTFDNDRFSHDNDNEIQAFGWDVWEMYEEAKRLYSYSMHDSLSVQRQAITNRVRYLTARTLLGIATTMVLTDGSLKLVTVQ